MKIAVAGKGGVGKTSLTAWLGDYLDRIQQRDVWMIDADPSSSLGQAIGLKADETPIPLIKRRDLINNRVGTGLINLNPEVEDLPNKLATKKGRKHLLVMGGISNAGGGCACSANSLVKALLAHLFINRKNEWILVDLEAGIEHLGRGTVESVDALVIVSEPSLRSLTTAEEISKLAKQINLNKQALIINRSAHDLSSFQKGNLPPIISQIPPLEGLKERQLTTGSVLGLPEKEILDKVCERIFDFFIEN
ncbi:MAG: nucleotide-binding protein [Candidatus Hodarchaeales archaeon]